ncbi:MAG TPA: hypothetical protein VJT85_06185 [Gemmatimonadaceae bacterium]|nr:hypothetical protein [Gemmatimonadaceae bacterium]
MPLRSIRHLLFAAAVLAVGAGCDGNGPAQPSTDGAAGTYVLESVSGRGPAEGTFILNADGWAQRQVRYAGTSTLSVMSGMWRIEAGEISFGLQTNPTNAFMWPVRGEWRGTGFTIRYPDPADGPDIIETYRRN